MIKGKNIYSSLKYESGVHRVQEFQILRLKVEYIPLQQQWLFLPEAEDFDVKLEDKDLRIDGLGVVVLVDKALIRQIVKNTTYTLRNSGKSTDEKSQIRNKEKVLKFKIKNL